MNVVTTRDILHSWGKILRGKIPMLSIEITRECPLSCPGCYAYGESHLGGSKKLTELSDFRGDALVNGILDLVERHDPRHVSLVGGEPLIRHRELSEVLPKLSRRGTLAMVVTSAVIPIPMEWQSLRGVTVAVSIDGLAPDHDERRKPATYSRILKNIEGRRINVHSTIVRKHVERPGYLDEFVAFWNAREEVNAIWFSVYTPQRGEQSPEMLTPEQRVRLADEIPELTKRYPKLMLPAGMARAFVNPPANPAECLFAKMSVNYTADLKSRVEPCVFGGDPDCSQCGCSASAGLHWVGGLKVAGPVKVRHFVRGSIAAGSLVNRLIPHRPPLDRWDEIAIRREFPDLIQIDLDHGEDVFAPSRAGEPRRQQSEQPRGANQ